MYRQLHLVIQKKKRILALVLVLQLVLLAMAGCGGNKADQPEVKNDPAKEIPNIGFFAYGSEPVLDWDPSSGTSNEVLVFHNVYETLLRYDSRTGQLNPLIAESYTTSEDGLEWIFNIRKGMKFHDGTDVNAEAVKYSIDRTMELNLGAAYIWDPVKEIQALDDYTVKFILDYPAPIAHISSSAYGAFIMSPTALKNNPKDWLSQGHDAGSGPYMVVNSKMGEEVVLDKFNDYWGGWNEKHYDKVVIRKVAEASSRRQLIESGEASVTSKLSAEDIEPLRANDNVDIIEALTFTNFIVNLNTEVEPLNNVKVRQALSYAFPYDDVINYAVGGLGTQSHGIIPEGIMGHSKDLPQYTFDLEKAKKLLTEAGYPEGGFTLSYHYTSGDEAQKKTGELYKSELKKIGVELEIRGMPWDSQYEMAKATNPEDRQDMFAFYWWPDNPLPSSWFYNLYRTQDTILWNLSYWSDKELDRMTEEADLILLSDPEKAEASYVEANRMLIEEAPTIFAYDTVKVFAVNSNFKGLEPNPAYEGVVFFNECYPEETK